MKRRRICCIWIHLVLPVGRFYVDAEEEKNRQTMLHKPWEREKKREENNKINCASLNTYVASFASLFGRYVCNVHHIHHIHLVLLFHLPLPLSLSLSLSPSYIPLFSFLDFPQSLVYHPFYPPTLSLFSLSIPLLSLSLSLSLQHGFHHCNYFLSHVIE